MKMIVPVLVSILIVAQAHASDTSASKLQWRRDYEAARIEAGRTGRPILIVVGSAGCGWCRKLEQTTLRDPDVIAAVSRVAVPVTMSADDSRDEAIVASLRLRGVPGLVMVDSQGKILARHEGYLDSRRFLGWFGGATAR